MIIGRLPVTDIVCDLDAINVGITRTVTNEHRRAFSSSQRKASRPATVRCDLFISGSANGCSFSCCYCSARISKLVQTAQILHLPKYDFLCMIDVRWLWFVNVWRLSAWVILRYSKGWFSKHRYAFMPWTDRRWRPKRIGEGQEIGQTYDWSTSSSSSSSTPTSRSSSAFAGRCTSSLMEWFSWTSRHFERNLIDTAEMLVIFCINEDKDCRLLSMIEHHSILQSFSSPDEFAAQGWAFEAFLSLFETNVKSTTRFHWRERRQRQNDC